VRQVGYLQGSYQDARSTKHKKNACILLNKHASTQMHKIRAYNRILTTETKKSIDSRAQLM